MFDYDRLDALFSLLRTGSPIPVHALSSKLGVTERTVRSDIARINETLVGHGARIEAKYRAGYHLVVENQELLDAFLQSGTARAAGIDSAQGRQRLLLYQLLQATEPLSATDLMDTVYVGESALREYLRRLDELLGSYGLALTGDARGGFAVQGREADKRRCFTACVLERNMGAYLAGLTAQEERYFHGIDLPLLRRTLHAHLEHFELAPDDFAEKNILMHLALAVLRVRSGFSIEAPAAGTMPLKAELFITETCNDVERLFDVALDGAERAHLYLHLVSNGVLETGAARGRDLSADIERLLQDVYQSYGFDLRADENLKASLLDHLRFVFDSRELGVSKKNPLVNTIRSSYPLAFEIALSSANRTFADEPLPLTADEAGYLALHIGAAIERSAPALEQRPRAVLVCGAGRSVSSMLEQRLKTLFGARMEVARTMGCRAFRDAEPAALDGTALVISTQPLENCPLPCVLVDYAMNEEDMKAVSKALNKLSSPAGAVLEEFFSPELFLRINAPMTKDSLLELMCARMAAVGAAGPGLLAAVRAREELAATDISSAVAIPHALAPDIARTQVAVALLVHPVAWNAQTPKIQIVFLLAFKPGDKLDFERLFDLVLNVAQEERLQRDILSCTSYEAFLAALTAR